MIYKLVEERPHRWYELLPFVLWSLREKPSSTTYVSPYTLINGTLPRGPLAVLKDSWGAKMEGPFTQVKIWKLLKIIEENGNNS